MEKYGVDYEKVMDLLALGLADNKEDALEKVASGKADGLIKEAVDQAKRDE